MSQSRKKSGYSLRSNKRLLIHPKFQIPLLITNLSVIVVFFAIAWVGVQNALLDLKPAAGLSGIEAESFRKFIDYQAASLLRSLILAFAIGTVTAGGMTLIISHRLAGPLVRLHYFFRSIVDGKKPIPKLAFRDGDYLQDLEPLINDAIKKIQQSSSKEDETEKHEEVRKAV